MGVTRTLSGSNIVKEVTYYGYEIALNEKRSLIRLLKPELLDLLLIENEKLKFKDYYYNYKSYMNLVSSEELENII